MWALMSGSHVPRARRSWLRRNASIRSTPTRFGAQPIPKRKVR
jgi:hypothetical protein